MEPIHVELALPSTWHGPTAVVVPPGPGLTVELEYRPALAGPDSGTIEVRAEGGLLRIPFEAHARDPAWSTSQMLGPKTPALAVGVGWRTDGYPTYGDLEPLLHEFVEGISSTQCLRHVAVFYAADLNPVWVGEGSLQGPWIDLEVDTAEDRIEAAFQTALEQAEAGAFAANWLGAGAPPLPYPSFELREDGYPLMWSLLVLPGPDDVPCCAQGSPTAPPPTTFVANASTLGCTLPNGTVAPPVQAVEGVHADLCGQWFPWDGFVDIPTEWRFDCPALDVGRGVELRYDGAIVEAELEVADGECTVRYARPCSRADDVRVELRGFHACSDG